ncbi:hypothetical protein, partial [Cryobacterium sp. MLB-32]|uniref:hypothetical protein n=1 Tax=Cryobacterium sp. MLB-32 TaxID=1529318 RepID=UPI0018CE2CAF
VLSGDHALLGEVLLIASDAIVHNGEAVATTVVDGVCVDGDFLAEKDEILAVGQDIVLDIRYCDGPEGAAHVTDYVSHDEVTEAGLQLLNSKGEQSAVERASAISTEEVDGDPLEHEAGSNQSAVSSATEHNQLGILFFNKHLFSVIHCQ